METLGFSRLSLFLLSCWFLLGGRSLLFGRGGFLLFFLCFFLGRGSLGLFFSGSSFLLLLSFGLFFGCLLFLDFFLGGGLGIFSGSSGVFAGLELFSIGRTKDFRSVSTLDNGIFTFSNVSRELTIVSVMDLLNRIEVVGLSESIELAVSQMFIILDSITVFVDDISGFVANFFIREVANFRNKISLFKDFDGVDLTK